MFTIDPELLYSLTYAPEGDGEGFGGAGPASGEGEGAKGAQGSEAGEGEGEGEGKGAAEGEGEGEPEAKLAPEIAELVEARVAKALLDKEEAARITIEAEAQEHEFDSRILETDGKVEESLGVAAGKVMANAKNLRVINAEGEPVELTHAQIDQLIFGPMNEHLAVYSAAQVAEAMDEYSAAYLATIPAEGHDAYLKATIDKKLTPAAHAQAYAEAMAPHTKAWKAREADFAEKRAEHGAAMKQEGFEAGKANPGQMGSQQGTKGTGNLREQYEKGTPEQRQELLRTRKDEVLALARGG